MLLNAGIAGKYKEQTEDLICDGDLFFGNRGEAHQIKLAVQAVIEDLHALED